MLIETAKTNDILNLHKLTRHMCGGAELCTCYDELPKETLAVITNWEQYRDRWILISLSSRRTYGAFPFLAQARELQTRMNIQDHEEAVFLLPPSTKPIFRTLPGDLTILNGEEAFSTSENLVAIFTSWTESVKPKEGATHGPVDVMAIDYPIDLLQKLAWFLGYEPIPRGLTPAHKQVDPEKWYAVDYDSNVRLKEYDSEEQALKDFADGNVPAGIVMAIKGASMISSTPASASPSSASNDDPDDIQF